MKLCFYQKLAVIIVSVFICILVLFFLASDYLRSQSAYEAEQKLHTNLATQLVKDTPLLKDGEYDHHALKNIFHTLMLLGPQFEFYYLNQFGEILTHSAKGAKLVDNKVELDTIEQFISGEFDYPLLSKDPKSKDSYKIFSAAEVYNQGQLKGYLYVIIGSEPYQSVISDIQQSSVLQQFVVIVVLGLLTLMIISLVLFNLVTRPLRQLSEDAIAFREADYKLDNAELSDQRWCANSGSEIDKLGCSFSELFAHIDHQMSTLQAINTLRKELLADLSHDLRTPLASMQGYIETLHIHGETLSQSDRAEFIAVCFRNTQNLKKLIDQIFELAYIEGGQVALDKEDCALGEFLHDVLSKFSLAAKNKGIQLSIVPEQASYFVKTDLAKLERVLTNLIDNAIRHTPEGGKVTLRAQEKDNEIILSVEDTGIGLDHHELDNIFLPRYQAANNQGQANKNVGLGLAITQKLVAMLGHSLSVKSTKGTGTTFSFKLVNL